MGSATSKGLPSAQKLRESILIKLHLALPHRDDLLENILLEKFAVFDKKKRGRVSRADFVNIVTTQLNILKPNDFKKLSAVMDVFEFSTDDGSVDYEHLISFLKPLRETSSYDIIRTLESSSSFYNVLQAKRTRDGQLLIIKQVSLDKLNSIGLTNKLRDLQQNISLLVTIRHPNLLRYLGSVLTSDTLEIVQEFSETTSLMAFGPMKVQKIQRYATQILQALEHLHANGISHGNLNTGTVYIDHCGQVKLGEFCVGKTIYDLCNNSATSSYGPKTDIYSFGVILSQMQGGDVGTDEKNTNTLSSFIKLCLQPNTALRPDAISLLQHEFLKSEPEDTNQMLSDVCSSLDVTMKRLHKEIPKTKISSSRRTTMRPGSSRRRRDFLIFN